MLTDDAPQQQRRAPGATRSTPSTRTPSTRTPAHSAADDVARARAGVGHTRVDDRLGPPVPGTGANAWRTFVRRYGWRAYALPILIVVTVAALVHGTSSNTGTTPTASGGNGSGGGTAGTQRVSSPPMADPSTTLKQDSGGTSLNRTALAAAALPAGAPYDATGDGTFRVLKGTTKKVGTGKLWRYDIEVENGLTGIDLAQFQKVVDTTLDDPRSWSGHGVSLQRVDSGPIDFHITLTSSMTVRNYCGYTIKVETSCYAPAGSAPGQTVNRVMLNDSRWVRGAAAYVGDLSQYRIYMINHEDGHALGHEHAHQCLPGGLAPTMMQQTFGLRSTATGTFCEANPWPYPPGVSGAPGAEQPDTDQNNEYGRGD